MTNDSGRRAVLIIAGPEGHSLMVGPINGLLHGAFHVTAQVKDLAELESTVERLAPDLLLTCIRFDRGMNVVPVLREGIGNGSIRCPVVVTNLHDSATITGDALVAGAAAFVPESLLADTIVETLEAALRGERTFPAGVTTSRPPIRRSAEWRRPRTIGISGVFLTDHQITALLEYHDGKGRDAVASTLGIVRSTVDYHFKEGRKRVGVDSTSRLMLWVRERVDELNDALEPEFT